MKAIGGYFELAERDAEGGYPVSGIRLNTGRNALEYIIRSIPDIRHIYLPLYTCDAVIQPIKRLSDVKYSFYHINSELELSDIIILQEGEYILVNNYFGLKDAYIAELAEKYGDHLIVDNSQALFAPVIPGIKAFYSARKFVGVADGGFAVGVDISGQQDFETDDSSKHDSHLFIRKEKGAEAGFCDYQKNERSLDNQSIKRMAPQTEDALLHIDYNKIITCRKTNFEYLHQVLGQFNQLDFFIIDAVACPMVYPFLVESKENLRRKLIANKVFVAQYWPNVLEWAGLEDFEYTLASRLISIPIDQRYGIEDMCRIANIILYGSYN